MNLLKSTLTAFILLFSVNANSQHKSEFISNEGFRSLQLEKGTSCHHCGSSNNPVYTYFGKIIEPNKTNNPKLATEEPEVSEVCFNCLQSGNIKPYNSSISELKFAFQEEGHSILDETVEKISKLPKLNFMQNAYWPICCNNPTQFIGNQPTEGTTYEDYICKSPDFLTKKFKLEDFYPLSKLSVMYTMNLFQCLTCSNKYWNFQYSGLLWNGPLSDNDPKPKTKNNFYELLEEDWKIVYDGKLSDNNKAKELLKKDIFVKNIKTEKTYNIHGDDFKNKLILFITNWDLSSAISIGYLKKRLDKGENIDLAFVYFQNTKEQITKLESDSWFYEYCYVLDDKSIFLKDKIVKVPLIIRPSK